MGTPVFGSPLEVCLVIHASPLGRPRAVGACTPRALGPFIGCVLQGGEQHWSLGTQELAERRGPNELDRLVAGRLRVLELFATPACHPSDRVVGVFPVVVGDGDLSVGAENRVQASGLCLPEADAGLVSRATGRGAMRGKRQVQRRHTSDPRTSLARLITHDPERASEGGNRGRTTPTVTFCIALDGHAMPEHPAASAAFCTIGLDLPGGLLAPCLLGCVGTGWQQPSSSGTISYISVAYLRWYGREGAGSSEGAWNTAADS